MPYQNENRGKFGSFFFCFIQVDLQPNENRTQYWIDLKRHWHLHQISDSSDEICRSDGDEFWWQVWIYGASILMHKRKSLVKLSLLSSVTAKFNVFLLWKTAGVTSRLNGKLFNMYSKRTKKICLMEPKHARSIPISANDICQGRGSYSH